MKMRWYYCPQQNDGLPAILCNAQQACQRSDAFNVSAALAVSVTMMKMRTKT